MAAACPASDAKPDRSREASSPDSRDCRIVGEIRQPCTLDVAAAARSNHRSERTQRECWVRSFAATSNSRRASATPGGAGLYACWSRSAGDALDIGPGRDDGPWPEPGRGANGDHAWAAG